MYVCMYVSMYEADSQRPAVLTSLLSAPAVLLKDLKDMLPNWAQTAWKGGEHIQTLLSQSRNFCSKACLRLWLFNWLLFCFRLEHRFLPIVRRTD